jgi:hypothetical protein
MAFALADALVDNPNRVPDKYAHTCANNRTDGLAYSVADRNAHWDAHETTLCVSDAFPYPVADDQGYIQTARADWHTHT